MANSIEIAHASCIDGVWSFDYRCVCGEWISFTNVRWSDNVGDVYRQGVEQGHRTCEPPWPPALKHAVEESIRGE